MQRLDQYGATATERVQNNSTGSHVGPVQEVPSNLGIEPALVFMNPMGRVPCRLPSSDTSISIRGRFKAHLIGGSRRMMIDLEVADVGEPAKPVL